MPLFSSPPSKYFFSLIIGPPSEFPLIDSPQRIKSNSNETYKKPTPLDKANKLRRKVILEPGHSPLDWARLKNSGADLSVKIYQCYIHNYSHKYNHIF